MKYEDRKDPATQKKQYGWVAFSESKCKRCGSSFGPFHLPNDGQELFGCGYCGYGVLTGEEGQPDCDAASDMLNALLNS